MLNPNYFTTGKYIYDEPLQLEEEQKGAIEDIKHLMDLVKACEPS